MEENKKIEETKNTKFKGYTIEELRYQKVLTLVRMEYVKEKIDSEFQGVKSRFNPSEKTGKWSLLSLTGKAAKALSFIDYFTIGLSLFRSARKISSLFKRNK